MTHKYDSYNSEPAGSGIASAETIRTTRESFIVSHRSQYYDSYIIASIW